MHDTFLQMFWEILLTFLWFGLDRCKRVTEWIFQRKNPHFLLTHKTHTFLLTDIRIGGEAARCQVCKIRLDHCRSSMKRRVYTSSLLLILALVAQSHADSFVGSAKDTSFYLDSIYILKVALTQSDCSNATPCTIQVASEGGSGTVFKNLYGNVEDTILLPYNFPSGQFKVGATRATLFFFGADGKAKDIWMIRLAYREVKPPMGVKRVAIRFGASGVKWNGMVNGRVFK